jgi:alpha-L-fucosidase
LFDSKHTDYDAVNTPAGRDLVKEWVQAFRAEGIKIGFYYSLLDWHHPSYTIDRNHPQSPSSQGEFERLKESAALDEQYEKLNQGKDMDIYRQYIKDQVRELLTNYGKIDILWLDYSFPAGKYGKGKNDWDSENLLQLVRELQSGMIVNDRLDLLDRKDGWDFTTPEQYKVSKWPERNGKKIAWETCQTISDAWGYVRDEKNWKDPKQLLVLLIETVSKGGNLILNVGPTARGYLNPMETTRLEKIGEWMYYHNRSIYHCTEAPVAFTAPENSLLTYNPETNRLYIHLLDYPLNRYTLKGYAGKVKYAQFLHDGSEIKFGEPRGNVTYQEKKEEGDLILLLPVMKPSTEIPVIELILHN